MTDADDLDAADKIIAAFADESPRELSFAVRAEEQGIIAFYADAGVDAARRTRKRAVLAAEVRSVLIATDISEAIVDAVCDRVLSKLGVALLVDGEAQDTSTIHTGPKTTMTLEEFQRREGRAP